MALKLICILLIGPLATIALPKPPIIDIITIFKNICNKSDELLKNQTEIFENCKHYKASADIQTYPFENEQEALCALYYNSLNAYCESKGEKYPTVVEVRKKGYEIITICNHTISKFNIKLLSCFGLCSEVSTNSIKPECLMAHYYASFIQNKTVESQTNGADQSPSQAMPSNIDTLKNKKPPPQNIGNTENKRVSLPLTHDSPPSNLDNTQAHASIPNNLGKESQHEEPSAPEKKSTEAPEVHSSSKGTKGPYQGTSSSTKKPKAEVHLPDPEPAAPVQSHGPANPPASQTDKSGKLNPSNEPKNTNEETEEIMAQPPNLKGNDVEIVEGNDQEIVEGNDQEIVNENAQKIVEGNAQVPPASLKPTKNPTHDQHSSSSTKNPGPEVPPLNPDTADSVQSQGPANPPGPQTDDGKSNPSRGNAQDHPNHPVEEIDVSKDPVNNVEIDEIDGESYFMTYFMIMCVLVVLGYIGYHNRIKVMALVLEGRRSKRHYKSRRPNSANYHKLDSNLEEAISSNVSKHSKKVIY